MATIIWEQCFASVDRAVAVPSHGTHYKLAPFFYAHSDTPMINFQCESCGKSYNVKDEMAGRTAPCQQCGQKITVPAPTQSDESSPFSVPVPPVSDNPYSQGTAAVWQAAAQIGQAAKSFGQAAAKSSIFSWLTDWEFQDVRVHKSYRQSYRSSYRATIIALVLGTFIFFATGLGIAFSGSDKTAFVIGMVFIFFTIPIFWYATFKYLCSLRLKYELLIIKLDCMIETAKAARIYVENKELEK